ncbi:Transcription factor IIIA [Cardamine amara subsp. amara]|uniref:Transcription factor IIIA n=1 Tax=Cardamine amara subsp. amara TaxID=228776 RepID=A0ABD1BRS8_CARAN
MAEETNIDVKTTKKKDIRNYLCQYCGISRSKKYLITSHIESHHKMEVEEEKNDEACEVEEDGSSKRTCQECGLEFKKPAHLKQHMLSHSLERPFECYVDDCSVSYKRKDHLNRHLLTHKGKHFKCSVENCKSEFSDQGNLSTHVKKFHSNGDSHEDSTGDDGDCGQKLFKCPVENCKSKFSVQANLRRHFKKLHSNGDSQASECSTGQTLHVCKEIGCGKAFKYASQLQNHQDSHVKLDSVEAFCSEPGCMKYFTNEECLKAHIRSCHQHINCEICGSKYLKKSIKRHLKTHEEDSSPEKFKCEVEGCSSTFSKASNLQKHVKAVHEDSRPFVCGFPDCGMRFAYKHVRNNHENSGCHTYTCGDFVESDEVFTSRPRGGLKRKQVTAEMLIRKRVMPPQFDSEEHETC